VRVFLTAGAALQELATNAPAPGATVATAAAPHFSIAFVGVHIGGS